MPRKPAKPSGAAKASAKAAPVLESDKKLIFPHALLISASAGSGKTYTLTQRYVQLLLSERVPNNDLSSILAVTFTNNAAKEMKARILGWLKDLALERDEEKIKETMALVSLPRAEIIKRAAALVERVIDNYSDFHVQTIDSFLARVMAASVDELKLPLKAEITMAYDVLIDLALYSMFSRIGKDLPAEEIDRFLAVLPKSTAYPWNPVARVKENFDSFLNQEGRTAGAIAAPPGGWEPALLNKFKAVLKETRALAGRFGPALVKDSAAAAMQAENITDFLAAYNFKFAIFNGQKKARFPEGWEKDIARLGDLVIELAELNSAAYYHPYVGVYGRFKEELERVKRGKTDVIHINDIAKRLASYINADNVPEVYLKLGERISHFLIDEFQDTNRLQWDIIRPLVEEGLSKTGSLFVVGDIKQAIYMFRNADYRIMRDFLDKAEGKKTEPDHISLASLGGELKYADLPVNYRSDGKLLEYVDSIFKDKLRGSPELLGEDITELTAYAQSVRPDRVKDGYVRTDVLELEDPDDPSEQKEWLLDAVASARGRYPLGEIAILVAKNKRIEPVVEWLTEAGVPAASLGALDIRKRKVVAELLSWLRFLESPSDDLAFADFITGEVFTKLTGLSREELLDFIFAARQRDRDALLYAEFRNHPRYGKYWEQHLDPAFRKAGYLPLYELVSLVYASFRVFANFPGEQAFLARLLDAVTSLEAEGVTSPRAFVDYASGSDEDKSKVFAIALPEYIDAVRVMTFHKSKGLGFSVVINLMYDERGRSDPMYFEERDGAINVYHITKAAAEQSVKLRPVYDGRRKDSGVQDLNILYVVSTRARHELYNLIVKKKRKTEAAEPKLTDLFTACELGKPAARKPSACPSSAPMEIAAPGPRPEQGGIARSRCRELRERPEQRFDASKPTYAGFFETAEGELVHGILARFIELPKDPEGAISAAFDELAPAWPFKFDKSKVVKSLVAFLKSPAAAPLFAAAPGRQVLVEAEFIDKNGSLFRMDRVLVDPDSVTVVDFKTGRENTAKYTPQMKNYLAILSEAYRKPAKGLLGYVDLMKTVALWEPDRHNHKN